MLINTLAADRDDTALAQAQEGQTDLGGGLDVYEDEPKVNPALFELDNGCSRAHRQRHGAHTPGHGHAGSAQLRNGATTGDSPPNLVNPRFNGRVDDTTTATSHRVTENAGRTTGRETGGHAQQRIRAGIRTGSEVRRSL